jgi:hypothetical protein
MNLPAPLPHAAAPVQRPCFSATGPTTAAARAGCTRAAHGRSNTQLPVGVQLIGRRGEERPLIAIAAQSSKRRWAGGWTRRILRPKLGRARHPSANMDRDACGVKRSRLGSSEGAASPSAPAAGSSGSAVRRWRTSSGARCGTQQGIAAPAGQKAAQRGSRRGVVDAPSRSGDAVGNDRFESEVPDDDRKFRRHTP